MNEEQALIAAVRAHPDDDTARLVLADWLEEHDQPERAAWLRDPDVSKWMAPDCVTPVPALLAALGAGSEDDDDQSRLRNVFRKAGAGVAPALREAVATGPESLREVIADVFAVLPAGTPRPLPELLEAVRGPDRHVTRVAVVELGWHGSAAAPAVPHLIAAWHRLDPIDQEGEYRRGYCAEIAHTFGRIGAAAASAVPVIMPCLDEGESATDFAHDALRAIGRDAAEAMFANLDRVRAGSFWAIRALAELAPDPRQYLLPLLRGDSGREADRVTAAEVIGEDTRDERLGALVPELLAALDANASALRAAAAGALGRIAEFAAPAEPALRAARSDPEPTVRLAAAESLTRFNSPRTGFDALEQLLGDPGTSEKARYAIHGRLSAYPEAWATLVRALRNPDPGVRRAASDKLPDYIDVNLERANLHLLCDALRDEQPEVRRTAAEIIYRAGDENFVGMPALLAALGDPDPQTRTYIGYALGYGEMGRSPTVLDGLLTAFRGPNLEARVHAAELMAARKDLPPEFGTEVANLMRLAKSPGRGDLLQLLVRARPLPADTVELIRSVLRPPVAKTRLAALEAVAELGPLAADAIPDLIALLDGGTDEPSHAVRSALIEIGDAVRAPLLPLLVDPRPELVSDAVFLFSRIGPPPQAGPRLVELTTSADVGTRQSAISALGKLPDPPPGALAALQKALEDADPAIVADAILSLEHYKHAARAAFPDILRLTFHENTDVRHAAVMSLGSFGGDANEVVPRLRDVLTGSDEEAQWQAAWAAGQLGADGAPLVPELLAGAETAPYRHRSMFVDALGAIGPAAGAAKRYLRRRIVPDEHENTRADAAAALLRIEPGAVDALAVLRELLANPLVSGRDRFTAAEAVLSAKPGDADTVAALRELQSHGHKEMVAAVDELLARHGHQAPGT